MDTDTTTDTDRADRIAQRRADYRDRIAQRDAHSAARDALRLVAVIGAVTRWSVCALCGADYHHTPGDAPWCGACDTTDTDRYR